MSVLAAAAVLVAVQWRSVAPLFRADEIGNMGNAYLFTHPDSTWLLAGNAYMPGTGLVVAAAWLITSDPTIAYRIAVVMAALLGLAAIAPLRALAREFGAAPNVATVTSALVVVAPSRALASNYVWGENLLVVCVATALLLVLRLREGPTVRHAVYLGAVAGAAFLAHGRALPFSLAVLAVGALLMRRHRRQLCALLGIGALTLSISYLLYRYVGSSLYLADERVSKTLDDISRIDLVSYAGLAAGQVWYTVAAWAGLTVIGAAALLARARREGWRGPASGATLVLLSVSATVPLLLSNPETVDGRAHVYIYGRYLDAFLVPLAVIGLVALVRGVRARTGLVVVGLGAVAAAGAALMLESQVPASDTSWIVTPGHVPGVAHLMRINPGDAMWPGSWWAVTYLGLVPAISLAIVARWRGAALAVVGCWALGLTVYSDAVKFDRFDQDFRVAPLQVEALGGINSDTILYGDTDSGHVLANGNEFTYWATPRAFVYMDTSRDTSEVEIFIAALDSEFAASHDAAPLAGTIVGNSATWVMPGELRDELEAQGRVMQRRDG